MYSQNDCSDFLIKVDLSQSVYLKQEVHQRIKNELLDKPSWENLDTYKYKIPGELLIL